MIRPVSLCAALLLSTLRAATPGLIQFQETSFKGVVAELTDRVRSEGILTVKMRLRNTFNATVIQVVYINRARRWPTPRFSTLPG